MTVKRVVGEAMMLSLGVVALILCLPLIIVSYPAQWLYEAWNEAGQ